MLLIEHGSTILRYLRNRHCTTRRMVCDCDSPFWLAQAQDVIFGAMSANAKRCDHKASWYQELSRSCLKSILRSFLIELAAKSSRKLQKAVLRTRSKYVGRLRSAQSSQRGSCGRHVKPGMLWLACGPSWGMNSSGRLITASWQHNLCHPLSYPVDLYIDVQFLHERWVVFLVIALFLDPLSETLWWAV